MEVHPEVALLTSCTHTSVGTFVIAMLNEEVAPVTVKVPFMECVMVVPLVVMLEGIFFEEINTLFRPVAP